MNSRSATAQMPPLATVLVETEAVEVLLGWLLEAESPGVPPTR